VIPKTILLAACRFDDRLGAERVAAAIEKGLRAGGWPEADLLAIIGEAGLDGRVRELLDDLDFDARMRRARAVVLAARRLQERTLTGSIAFEIATRARQAGVPAYGVAAENRLGPFDARMLDLQVIVEAASGPALVAAGKRLAGLI
jgi:glycerate kinase